MADNIIDQLKPELDKVKGDISTIVEKVKADTKGDMSALEVTLRGEIKAANEAVNELKVKFDEADKAAKEADAARQRTKTNQEKEGKSFDLVLKDALTEATDDLNKFAKGETKSFEINIKAAGDITTGNVTGSRYGQILRPGVIPIPNRRKHLRELIPNGTVEPGNTYTYMCEVAGGQGAPAPTSEGGTKPQFDMNLIEATVGIETIAGFVVATRKAMRNIPGFISWLQMRMPEKLLLAEDAQILYGDGTSPNLKGILTSGNYTDATSGSGKLVEQIIDSLAQLEDSDTEPRTATGILMRPAQYYNFFKNKASGSGEYDLPENVSFVNDQLFISGVPVAATTALLATDYVVGDFDMGAQLLIAEGMRIEFFEQDSDNVRKNKVTVRIEETVALPVFGSTYFIKGAVPA